MPNSYKILTLKKKEWVSDNVITFHIDYSINNNALGLVKRKKKRKKNKNEEKERKESRRGDKDTSTSSACFLIPTDQRE